MSSSFCSVLLVSRPGVRVQFEPIAGRMHAYDGGVGLVVDDEEGLVLGGPGE